MIRTIRSSFAFALCWGLCMLSAFAQSNPTPYSLSSGSYTFTQWDATNPAGTYPANMVFQNHNPFTTDPTLTDEPNGDYTGAYNATAGARINGKGVDGFSFVNTTSNTTRVGASVLALNTTGRTSIQVTWTGGTVLSGTREYRIRLQYRTGTTGAFTDVLSGGNPVEYIGAATGNAVTFGPTTLPVAAENQSVLQLRWKYYYTGTLTGGRPELRVDDITVSSSPSAGSPTKLAVTAINPVSPSNTSPFSITVTAQDASNAPKNVITATTVSLSLASGTGTLGGTLTGTIPAGQSQVTITGVTYNTAQSGVSVQATRTSGDALTSGTSNTFTVQQGATQLAFVNVPATGFTNFPLTGFTAEARRPNGTIDTTFTGPITLTMTSGTGTMQGTLTRNAVRGVATFSDISFNTAGSFTFSAAGTSLTNANSSTITISQAPQLTDLIIPQYIKSLSSTQRIPAFALIRLDSLRPNSTYRYFAGGSGPATTSTSIGGGVTLHYNYLTNNYTYSTFRQLDSTGGFSTFRTGTGQTSMTLWINLIPSTNAAFTPGNNIRWILALGDSTGRQVGRLLTTATSTAIDFGTTTTTATGIADRMSMGDPKNFIALYDNIAGTGSPISTAIIQEDGAEVGGAPFFYADLDDNPTAWATLIPNNLPNGIRRIEERSPNGTLIDVQTDADGIYNRGVSTINPSGGLNAIYIETPFIALIFPDSSNICSTAPLDLRFFARGIDSVSIQVSRDSGRTFQQLGRRSAMDSVFSIPTQLQIPGSRNSFRVIGTQNNMLGDTSGIFSISTPVTITRQPRSVSVCEGSPVTLGLIADGTGLTYQLQKEDPNAQGGFSNVPGANQAQFTIQNTQQVNAGTYRIIVSGSSPCPSVVSDNFVVSVNRPTRVVQQPENQRTTVGGTVTLTAGFEIAEPATYQWRRGTQVLTDNAKYSGTTSSVLTIRNVQQTEVDEAYTVTATGLCGSATSNPVRVSIVSVVVGNITPLSGDSIPCLGGILTLTSRVTTSLNINDLVYEWYRGNTFISKGQRFNNDSTVRVLVINNFSIGDTGTYRLIARDPVTGSADTATYRVTTFNKVPVFSLAPQSQSICPSDSLRFEFADRARYTIQIVRNDTLKMTLPPAADIQGLTLAWGQTGLLQSGNFKIIASNACGSDTASFTITLKAATAITQQPSNQVNITAGVPLTLTVQATGSGTLTYQWFKDGVVIPGATSATYTKSNTTQTDAGTYTVRVTGECGNVTSGGSVVFVGPNSVEGYAGAPGLKLEQNMPNPFSDETSVSFSIPAMTNVTLVVRDVLGRTLQVINLGTMQAGEHTSRINAADIPNGTYYYTLQTDNANITRRFLIVR